MWGDGDVVDDTYAVKVIIVRLRMDAAVRNAREEYVGYKCREGYSGGMAHGQGRTRPTWVKGEREQLGWQ
jgi:hypothetical protein